MVRCRFFHPTRLELAGKGASEVVAALAPGARIVKAFNSIVTARFNEGPGLATGGRLQQAGGPLAGRDIVDFGGH
jgi:8-hydroxy-5-deazaflavin:NADPH oxidoreductase